MLSETLEQVIDRAYKKAQKEQCEFLTIEHLLLALLDEEYIAKIIKHLGGDNDELKRELRSYISEHCPNLTNLQTTQPTAAFQRVIQRSVLSARAAGRDAVTCLHALISITSEQDSYAAYFLRKQQISQRDLMSFSGKVSEEESEFFTISDESDEEFEEENLDKALELFTVNLNRKAMEGKIDVLIGREEELNRTMQTLCRRRKNNPILVGEAGVGKTAIIEGLALAIVEKQVPAALEDAEIYSLDIGSLVAGTQWRGDFERRIKKVLEELAEKEKAILFIDEIHTIIGAGAGSNSQLDVSNLIKPALSNGTLRCIGATTDNEYRRFFEKDHALARRFQKVTVNEPSRDECLQIVGAISGYYEDFHGIEYTDDAIYAAVDLSNRYLRDRQNPDKALDLLDEAGAQVTLKRGIFAEKSDKEEIIEIGAEKIEEIVAKIAGIPETKVSQDDKSTIKNLEQNLKSKVFGQEKAISEIVSVIKLSRAGLREKEKPVGNFLFTGPTGVGKTEICRALAECLNIKLLRFDMSEYMEQHSVARLIGAPPGYVGHDKEGLLAQKIRKNPYAVLLLDEIEKAHPDINNILLQIMDNGIFTDADGKECNCRNLIIIMTSNIGAFEADKNRIGFAESNNAAAKSANSEAAMKRRFSPEFRNRLDAVVNFAALDKEHIYSVVNKFIKELKDNLQARNIYLELSEDVRKYLAEKGYDPKMGARPMARLIQKEIKEALADELLFGKLANFQTQYDQNKDADKSATVLLKLLDGKVNFDVQIHRAKQLLLNGIEEGKQKIPEKTS